MALAVALDIETTRRVVDGAARAWARSGATVVEMPLASISGIRCSAAAVMVPDLGVVECVADGDFASIAAAARVLSAEGWDVAVLVPAPLMGEAHRVLRGGPARLQPWWRGAEDAVLFGVPEVP
jgi:hypothetical protein